MRNKNTHGSEEVLDQIAFAIESLRYGSVEITVHEGRVTQIKKREKVRFQDQTKNELSPSAPAVAKKFKTI
jgi:hypothetical protein